MSSTRTLTAALLVVGALTAVLIGWFGSGWRAVEREQRALVAAARAEAAEDAARLADELVAELELLRASESQRPYFHYQNLFHDPRGASLGWSVVPSPLATGPSAALVAMHFQLDPAGELTSPTVNPEVPENNAPVAASDLAMLAELAAVKAALVAPADPVQVAMARPAPVAAAASDEQTARPVAVARNDAPLEPKPARGDKLARKVAKDDPFGGDKVAVASKKRAVKSAPEPVPQVVQIDPEVYAQNLQSNEIFVSSRQGKGELQQAQQAPRPAAPRTPQEPQASQTPQAQQAARDPAPTAARGDGDRSVQLAGNPPEGDGPVPDAALAAARPTARPSAAPRTGAGAAAAPPPDRPVTITIAPLVWRPVRLAGAPALVAVRSVTTPDGQLTQGLVVSTERLGEWLAEREPATHAALVAAAEPPAGAVAPVALAGVGWWIALDDSAALAAARAAGDGLRSAFLGRFVPITLLALVCAVLVVLLTARAEKLARQRARFAAAAAHELRTPLAGIQLYGDMLVDGLGDPAKHRDYARRVAEEASRLGRVVANVLGFSQLERRSLALRAEAGDAVEAVRAAVERAEPALLRAGAAVELEAPAAAPARFDRDALARILGNLLDNAEKYTREHEDRTITVTVRPAGDRVEIEIADRGPGLPPGLRRRRFEPFTRGIGDDGPPGLGLGLALSQSLAQAMDGDLSWRDRSPGATFVVTLPAR